MIGWLCAWAATTAVSIVGSADPVASIARSAWTVSLAHKNDAAVVPLILAFAPLWLWMPGAWLILRSGSRNAVLGLFVVALCRLPGRARRTAPLVGVVAGLVMLAASPYFVTRGTARLGHWIVAGQMWLAAPWLGQGPFTFTDFYLRGLPTALPFGIVPEVAVIPWAHSLYLEVLAERGLLGFAVFAGVIAWTLTRGRGATRHAMLALLAMGLFDLTFLKAWVSLAFWGIAWSAGRGPA